MRSVRVAALDHLSRRARRARYACAVALLLATYASAQGTPDGGAARKSVSIARTDARPLIDGKLDDATWAQAAVVDDLFQIRPGDGTPPSERTELYLLYDKDDIELPQGDFTTRLARATAEVGFNARLVWISLFQYDNVSEVFGLHSRLHWIPRAGREAFLVVNRSFQDFDKNNSFQSVTSELSVKANYTFRF